jgi:hypothetical protein
MSISLIPVLIVAKKDSLWAAKYFVISSDSVTISSNDEYEGYVGPA